MKVLITGAGGFIGSHLVDSQLEKKFDVRAVDLHPDLLKPHENHPRLELIRGNLTDEKLVKKMVEGMDIVYHLASAHLDVSLSDKHYRHVNVDATLSLVDAAMQAGVQRFIHCSSVGVIGDVENPPADETTACHPTNVYERTKLEGERAALDFSRRTGFPVVVMRPAWVYGPRCPRTAKLIRTISKGRFPIFGDGRNLRHPVYISDAIRGLELCAEIQNVDGEVFIIAGEVPVETRELVNVISCELNVRMWKIHLPIFLGQWAGLLLELLFKPLGKQPPFSRRSMDFFLKHNAYSVDKAKRRLGYQPQIDLQTGIRKILASMKINEDSMEEHG
jgi:nucleoside-diphosphate-sugar epimerase